jgi:exonuclease SbcD
MLASASKTLAMNAWRLLHTSDWHLGHTLHDWSREREHQAFLKWLLDAIESEGPDALLIAGDVFETSNPSAAALEQWFTFLGDCARRFPLLHVIAIGGNHDSASRLDAPNPLLAHSRLRVVGGLAGRSLADCVVPVEGKAGRLWVCAVPFVRAQDATSSLDDPLAKVRTVYGQVFAEVRARRAAHEPVVAMGHLYMVGGEVSELSERRVFGGNQHALPVDVFPDDVAYVALGHLHKAQRVGGLERVRYSGSPLPLSMSEATYRHQIVRVDFEDGELREVKSLAVPRMVDIIRMDSTVDRVVADIERLEARDHAADPWQWPYLDVRLKLEKPEPGVVRKIHEALEDRAARLVRIERSLTGTGAPLSMASALNPLTELKPESVFRLMYQKAFQGEPDAALVAAFHETIEASHQEKAP